MSDQRCLHCGEPIRLINYAMGPEWLHVNPDAGFPTTHKGSAWKHCKRQVATPAPSGEAAEPTTTDSA